MSSRDPMTPAEVRRVLVFCGMAALTSVLISTVLAITVLTTRSDVSVNRSNAVTAKKRANVAQDTAAVAKTKAAVIEHKQKALKRQVIQTRVLVRETRTILKQKGILGKTGATGRAGLAGSPGPGPTATQINDAVTAYCASNPCGRPPTVEQVLEGLQRCSEGGGCRGSDGKDAPAPTDMQLMAAVAAYCAPRGGCAGVQGIPGADGGPGPQGPGPSDEQVQAAVDTYCTTHMNCAPTPVVVP